MSKETNVAMLFSKVNRRRCQEINKKTWDKAKETLDLAQSVSYTNVRGKKCRGTHSTYVCFGHRKDPLGKTLGRYSLLPNTPDTVKKQVNDSIGDLVILLEAASRSVLYCLQSTRMFLNVKDKYKIPDVFDHRNLDDKSSELRRGFATQFCVGVNYWSSVHIDNDCYYTTMSCLSEEDNDTSILFYFVFPSYKVAVAMRSGDVLCFNPLVYHCCTNPVKLGVRIFSCYVSSKTCNTQIAVSHANAVPIKIE